ncbi:glycine receptor subunit alphaZ1-like isoform X2 [Tubulanus polymorphus]|uniref:glycine receptor subunit alphaZ1-like isoform X2 n=1 Tax=Tubulanus polymorphus TaxID=672921 RepID=UPI003DA35647
MELRNNHANRDCSQQITATTKRPIFILLVVLSTFHSPVNSVLESDHLTEKLSNIHYDKYAHPGKHDKKTTEVHVSAYINDISAIDEVNMEMNMDFIIRQSWMDRRLANFSEHMLSINGDMIDSFWQPDPYFPTAKFVRVHSVISKTRALYINRNGHVTNSMRLTVGISCPMEFFNYPMDDQQCSLNIESYILPANDLIYSWTTEEEHAVVVNPKMQLSKFNFEGDPQLDSYINNGMYRPGNWSGIRIKIFLHRQFIYYLIQLYVPSALVVVVSWVSFWLDVDAAPARVSLGVLTVLTITTQSANANSAMPQVSYVKAMDVWLATCLCFVFAALLEYALATTIVRKQRKVNTSPAHVKGRSMSESGDGCAMTMLIPEGSKLGGSSNGAVGDNDDVEINKTDHSCYLMLTKVAKRLDAISRILFPGTFILFNLAYWPMYMYFLTEEANEK